MRRFEVCGGGNGQLFYAHERPAEQGSGGLGAGGLITLTTSITSWNRIADANVLARAVLQDDPLQATGEVAAALLERASLIAFSLPSLCEFAWVLWRGANFQKKMWHSRSATC